MSKRCLRYGLRMLVMLLFVWMLCLLRRDTALAEELTGYSAEEIVEQMGVGWNLGNSFDATGGNAQDVYSQEQSWGNPIVTKELIDAVKEAGFNTLRIPVTWYRHLSEDGTYTIDSAFLNRIKTIVDYAYANDMFVILNVHHEEWINTASLASNYENIGKQLGCIWSQLAEAFASYDQHLIFEGMNEPRLAGTDIEWTGNPEAYEAVNYLTQVFVNTVRRSENGYNQERCLMIPGYAASSSASILSSISIPTANGETVENLIISVHCYSPYSFCLSDERQDFDPNDPGCTGEIDTLFSNIQEMFLDQGIPVIVGETSATNQNNKPEREEWAAYMAEKSASYGVPIIIWDNGANGSTGGENHAYIDRDTLEWNYPSVVQTLIDTFNSITWASGREEQSAPSESLIGGSVLWGNSAGLTSSGTWDASHIVLSASQVTFAKDREIAIVYSGSGEPGMVLDSAEKNAYWIPVDASRTETLSGGKKAAYFTYEDMLKAMKAAGVDEFSQLRNMSFMAKNNNITSYEVCVAGGTPLVTYMVNGQEYYVGADLPNDPIVENMTFDGWYTTKNYQAGTKYYAGEKVSEDTVVYAKLLLTSLADIPVYQPEETETTEQEATDPERETTQEQETTIPEGETAAEQETASEPEATAEQHATPSEGETTAEQQTGTLEQETDTEQESSSEDSSASTGEPSGGGYWMIASIAAVLVIAGGAGFGCWMKRRQGGNHGENSVNSQED